MHVFDLNPPVEDIPQPILNKVAGEFEEVQEGLERVPSLTQSGFGNG